MSIPLPIHPSIKKAIRDEMDRSFLNANKPRGLFGMFSKRPKPSARPIQKCSGIQIDGDCSNPQHIFTRYGCVAHTNTTDPDPVDPINKEIQWAHVFVRDPSMDNYKERRSFAEFMFDIVDHVFVANEAWALGSLTVNDPKFLRLDCPGERAKLKTFRLLWKNDYKWQRKNVPLVFNRLFKYGYTHREKHQIHVPLAKAIIDDMDNKHAQGLTASESANQSIRSNISACARKHAALLGVDGQMEVHTSMFVINQFVIKSSMLNSSMAAVKEFIDLNSSAPAPGRPPNGVGSQKLGL